MSLLPRLHRLPLVLAVAALGWLATSPPPLAAQQPGDDPSPYSELELVAEPGPVRPGGAFTVAVRVALDPGWHTYWLNGGDAGLPLVVAWELPPGFEAGPLEFPVPKRIPVPPLMSYGYEGEMVALARVTAPDPLPEGPLSVAVSGEWLVCLDVCLPAMGEARTVLGGGADAAAREGRSALIADARARLPSEPVGWRARAWAVDEGYLLEVEPAGESVVAPYFYADEIGVVEHPAAQRVVREDGVVRMLLPRSQFADSPVPVLRGLLEADAGEDHGAGWTLEVPVEAPVDDAWVAGAIASLAGPDAIWTGGLVAQTDASSSGADAAGTSLLAALLLAVGGGLLLNLMPCVFPVLAVKVLGFVQQGGAEPRQARGHALAFAGGVMVSLWILAGLLFALRSAGQSLGWGFQLQSPAVVAVLALVLFALALNLSGVFELGLGLTRLGAVGDGGRYRDSFLTGGLTVVVATPCTAPFMGVALGYALVQPALVGLSVFTALGVGLVAPYFLLTASPDLLRRLPRPGAWMEGLKQALAFPLYLSVVWLAWVLGRQLGVDSVAMLLVALTLLALAAWSAGRVQTASARAARAIPVVAGALALVVAVGAARLPAAPSQQSESGPLAWETYSPERVLELRAEGRPIFVDFTAAWCLTCQVNERVTLSHDDVLGALGNGDIALLRADWTNRDPAIADALATFGRSAIPLYVLYPADADAAPELLPAVLTPGIVLDAVARATSGGALADGA